MNIFSNTLMRSVPVNVYLPIDGMGKPEKEVKPFKTLYLLHGIFGSSMDWVNGSRVQQYAEDHRLCVVMPSADNGFYVDNEKSFNRHGEFVGRELVELTRKIFPLSEKREDTYIGGFSMGGYGALRNGLKYHETFGAVVALSSALVTDATERWSDKAPTPIGNRGYAESVFGDLNQVAESDMNPRYLAKQLKDQGVDLPRLYVACGTEDFLFSANEKLVKDLQAHGIDVTYDIGPGVHNWDFWDAYVKRGIDWLEEK